MAFKRPGSKSRMSDVRTELTVPAAEAREKLEVRLTLGRALFPAMQTFHVQPQNDRAVAEFQKWDSYNSKLLERLFTTDQIARQYDDSGFVGVFSTGELTANEVIDERVGNLKRALAQLESIVESLDLYRDPADSSRTVASAPEALGDAPKVFVVHGRNGEKKQEVARCIERLGLEPVILHERPNGGKTLIEKFEEFADVGFAVVLLTGDDQGGIAGAENQHPRARQNVVFEMGYFCGRLTRSRVCALYEKGVELPSDLQGIVYTLLDESGAWRFALAEELSNCGYAVDANNLLSRR